MKDLNIKPSDLLCVMYSAMRMSWGVYKKETEFTMKHVKDFETNEEAQSIIDKISDPVN